MHEGGLTEKTQEKRHPWPNFGSSFYMIFPPPPESAKQEGCFFTWDSHSGHWTFLCFIFRGFLLLCLLTTAILNYIFLFKLPNIPTSRDGRPNSLGIGALSSLWLLPAEVGQWGPLGLPLLLVSSLRVLIAVSIYGWVIFSVVGCSFIYPCWTGTACCSLLTWAETKPARQLITHGTIISSINMVIKGTSRGIEDSLAISCSAGMARGIGPLPLASLKPQSPYNGVCLRVSDIFCG